MFGKDKCRILKDIRRKIADENDIHFVTRECTYHGECTGTCPRCESELRYLEKQLAQRAALGKRITVAALCAGIAVTGVGCSNAHASSPGPDYIEELSGDVPYDYGSEDSSDTGETECRVDTGKPAQTAEDGSEGSTNPVEDSGSGASVSDPDFIELSGEVPYDYYDYVDGDPSDSDTAEGGEDAGKAGQTEDGSEEIMIDDNELSGMVAY